VIHALAAGDAINWDNAKLAFNQLFLSTASGKYLDQRAGDVGQRRPPEVALTDDIFRRLAVITKTRKLTQEAILEVLEVFYGVDAVRASIVTSVSGPYVIKPGEDLVLRIDENLTVSVVFGQSGYARSTSYSANEVAAEITRTLKDLESQAFAVSEIDPSSGLYRVRVYSASRGLSSSVRIIGGKAQNALLFPTSLFVAAGMSPFATWDIQLSPTVTGNLRFTMTAGTVFDLSQVVVGDLAYVYGAEFSTSGCHGTYEILDVAVYYSGITKIQYFEIANPMGVQAMGVSQIGFDDLAFFRPTKFTIYDQLRHVMVAQSDDTIDVTIPPI